MDIKIAVKKKLNSGSKIDVDELYGKIKKYDYISFDIFDTLVKRNVEEPADIFAIMEKMVGGNFKNRRITAEKKARAESGKKEILIDDIYNCFPKETRGKLIRLELDTELKAIVSNQKLLAVFKKCIDDGKTVLITSDMYWPEEMVKKLLEVNGYSGYKALYLSSSAQKIKSDGSLFKHLLEQEGIKAERVVHIGDSKRSDYDEPKKLGIEAIRIPRYIKNIEFRGDERNDTIEVNYLNHFINNTVPNYDDPYYQFGYSQLGKLLYGYVHWIHDETVKRDIHKLFFFARDGYIMKQAYEACFKDEEIEVRYLEVSRRSLRGPIIWMDYSYDTILKMVVNAKLVTLESIFDGLGLVIDEHIGTIEKYGLKRNSAFDRSTISADGKLRKLLDELMPDIVKNSKKEYELLLKYLSENAVSGKFGVIDIGYGGSMQQYLQQVLTQIGIEHEITGFYLAVTDFYTKNMLPGVRLDLNGYLFDFLHDKHAVDTRSSFVGLFETLFLEQGGSVKRYVEMDGSVHAERYPYEYEIDDKPTDDLLKIRKIQQGALNFVEKASKDELIVAMNIAPSDYFFGLHEVGTDPTLEDLDLLGDIHFYDEGMTEQLAAPMRLSHYVAHPKEMKNDFLKCRWKTGFLKRLFKIKLPYQKIYERLRTMG